MKECKYFKKYKGLRPPKCNGGFTCDSCLEKWQGTAERAIMGALTEEDLKKIKDGKK